IFLILCFSRLFLFLNLQMTLYTLKKCLRKKISQILTNVSNHEILDESATVLDAVRTHERIGNAHRIGIYVSTDKEIITDGIIDLLFHLNKKIYIPNFKKGESEMKFIGLLQSEWDEGLPYTMWNIRQHSFIDSLRILDSPLDVLLMPGVAFSTHSDGVIKRLGHGMGYFDRFLHQHSAEYGRLPYLMGLSLRQQIVESVPVEDHDVPLNYLVYAHSTMATQNYEKKDS
ncbi:hypothetical protein PENTCL1PPCAC_22791, partial [Pristionchus entomophagus]